MKDALLFAMIVLSTVTAGIVAEAKPAKPPTDTKGMCEHIGGTWKNGKCELVTFPPFRGK